MARNMETGGQRIFPTFQQIGDNLSNTGTSIVNSLPNKNELTKALRDPEFYSDVGSRAKNMFTSMHPMDQVALTTAPFPILGDVTGLAADARMFSQEPESRTPLNFGLSALGALPFIPAASSIKAFHGTPHKVDKFSMDNIGTGEGAQAYGHGLYFADSEDVAKQYQKALQESSLSVDSTPISNISGGHRNVDEVQKLLSANHGIPEQDAFYMAEAFQQANTKEDALKWLDNRIEMYRINNNPEARQQMQGIRDSLDSLDLNVKAENTGNLYNVNLDVNPEDLLDWDAPLSKQSEKVRNAISDGMTLDRAKEIQAEMEVLAEAALSERITDGVPTPKNDAWEKMMKSIDYKVANAMTSDKPMGSKFIQMMPRGEAEKFLNSRGVPGIQYYDGMSRGAGKGTRNYVMFDDNLIDIVDPIDDIVNKHNAALDSVK